ncbi:tripartite tricarboxylate transporter TctB family protein [Vibrio sp.]|nr:tripartite tricarboxylate transporter TctB family protein [Vibrio viridaestus]MDC0611665.1 tripartite tricarboxylate transporter TctB family protein [Vibrio sp.]
MSFRMAESLVALGMIVLAILGWFQIQDLPNDALMFPAVLLLIIAILSAALFVRGLIGKASHFKQYSKDGWRFAISTKRMLFGFLTLALYFLTIPYVGFFTCSFILIIAVAKGAGYHKRLPLALSAFGFCIFVYLIFVALFERPLPKEFFVTLFANSI